MLNPWNNTDVRRLPDGTEITQMDAEEVAQRLPFNNLSMPEIWALVEGVHYKDPDGIFSRYIHSVDGGNDIPEVRKIQSQMVAEGREEGIDSSPLLQFISQNLPSIDMGTEVPRIAGKIASVFVDFSGIQSTIHQNRRLPEMRGASELIGEWTRETALFLLEEWNSPGLIQAAAGAISAIVLLPDDSANITPRDFEEQLYNRLAQRTEELYRGELPYGPLPLTQIGPRAVVGIAVSGEGRNNGEDSILTLFERSKLSSSERKLTADWRNRMDVSGMASDVFAQLGTGRANERINVRHELTPDDGFRLPGDFTGLSNVPNQNERESLVYLVGDGNNGGARFIDMINQIAENDLSPFYGRFLSMSFVWALECAKVEAIVDCLNDANCNQFLLNGDTIRIDPLYGDGDDLVYIIPASIALFFTEKLHDRLAENLMGNGVFDEPDISYCFGGSIFSYSQPIVLAQLQAEEMESIGKSVWREFLGPIPYDENERLEGRQGVLAISSISHSDGQPIIIDFHGAGGNENDGEIEYKLTRNEMRRVGSIIQSLHQNVGNLNAIVNRLVNLNFDRNERGETIREYHRFVFNIVGAIRNGPPQFFQDLLGDDNQLSPYDVATGLLDITGQKNFLAALRLFARTGGVR